MTSGILVRLGLDPYSDRGPIVPDFSPSKTLPLRPTIPVVAMLLSVCGATAVFAAILWQFLEHRAQHRFAFESKNVATGLEKRVAAAMEDLRRLQSATPRPVRAESLPDFHAVELLWRESTAPTPSAIFMGIRSNGNLGSKLSSNRSDEEVMTLQALFNNTSYPMVKKIQLPGWSWSLPDCDCVAIGTDLFKPHGSLDIKAQIMSSTIASGAIRIIHSMSMRPEDSPDVLQHKQPSELFLVAIAPLYSSRVDSMPANSASRLGETEGLLAGVYTADDLFRTPLKDWSRDFHIKLQYGEAEHGELHDWGPPIVLGAITDTPKQFHASYDVDLAGIPGRIHLEPTSHWLRSTGTWTALVVLGVGMAGALWLAVWMTRQIELSRNREFETMELRAANTALAVVREAREQITRELHDNTLQNLYALGLELKRGRERLNTSPDETRDCLDRGLEEIRHISHELRQFLTQSAGERVALGAVEVFNSILERFRRGSGADIQMHLDPDAVLQISAHATAELAQILREAISNALRHGNATRIDIRLTTHGSDGWQFSIRDNGSGFDPAAPRTGGGLGLGHMDTRASQLGASFTLDARPGEGCQITLTQPGSPVPIPSVLPA